MNIAVYLTDYAQVDHRGKLTAVGFGWTRTTAPVRPHSIVLIIDSDLPDSPVEIPLNLRLLDEADNLVTDSVGNAIQANINVRSIRQSDGTLPGITHVVLTMSDGLPIPPGLYRWDVTWSGSPEANWTRRFEVIPEAPESTDELTVTVE